MIKRFVFCLVVFSLICTSPHAATAEPVSGWDDVVKYMEGFGGAKSARVVDKTLRIVVKHQLSRYKRDVTLNKPLDFRLLGANHASVAVDAHIKKAGSARARGNPAIFVMLFRKNGKGGLSHEAEHLIVFNGEKESSAYDTLSNTGLMALFRKSGATLVDVAKAGKPEPKPIAKPVAKKISKPTLVVLDGADIKKGVVAEGFIDSAITRDSEMKSALSGYLKKGDLPKVMPVKANAGSPELQMRLSALESRVKELEALLSNVTRKGGNLYFNGVNVYVTNGTGSTGKLNGRGNLIVGYGSTGKGSHNLVVGSKNRYEGAAGIISGRENALTGDFGVVLGGEKNEVTGSFSVIAGGRKNQAPGSFVTIFGGEENTAKGEFTSINGQKGRTKGGANPHFTGKKTNE